VPNNLPRSGAAKLGGPEIMPAEPKSWLTALKLIGAVALVGVFVIAFINLNSSGPCVSVIANNGWQSFTLNGKYSRVNSISRKWSIGGSYDAVGFGGLSDEDEKKQNKIDPRWYDLPDPKARLGALLINVNGKVSSLAEGITLDHPRVIQLRINDVDVGLNDNLGSLMVCFAR
jgi:hypothetical protein